MKKRFSTDDNNKKYQKVKDHCSYTRKYRGAVHDICNLRYKTPKEIPVVFHNGSKYDYHFIIIELAEEFEGEFECLDENTEKLITFSVPLKLSEGLHNGSCIGCKSCLDNMTTKDEQLIFRCFRCKKNYEKNLK